MIRLLANLGPTPSPYEAAPGSLGFALPSIGEDPDTGLRYLLLDVESHDHDARARAEGVAVVVVPAEDPTQGQWCSIEQWTSAKRIVWRPLVRLLTGAEVAEPPPLAPVTPFVHLHAHSHFSALDGFSRIEEMIDVISADHQPGLAITDHGVNVGHPELVRLCEQAGKIPVLGNELYFVNDRRIRPPSKPKAKDYQGDGGEDAFKAAMADWEAKRSAVRDYWHLVAWAMNDQGLVDLWALSTEANRTGSYNHPLSDWELLERFGANLAASTGCLRGPVADRLAKGDVEGAEANLRRLRGLFPDRLYVELHTNGLPQQQAINLQLVEMAHRHGLPLIAVSDSHYAYASHKEAHRVWIAAQTNKDLQEDSDLFSNHSSDYHLLSAVEVRDSLATHLPPEVIDEAMANTLVVMERCQAKLPKWDATPVFSTSHAADYDRLVTETLKGWGRTHVSEEHPVEEYEERLVKELDLLGQKHFAGYFLVVAEYVSWAKRHGILVGPGRGSGGGSLVAYMTNITEMDPVDADLLFERFMTPGRTSLPDFDIDFPASKREVMMEHLADRWGEDRIVRVGTHTYLKNRGVMRTLASVLKTTVQINYADIELWSKTVDELEASTAGLGLDYEELLAQGDKIFGPMRERNPYLFSLMDVFVDRLKSYGRHASGVVISTNEPITDRIPLRMVTDEDTGVGQLVSEFDMDTLESFGLVKFDFLTLSTLDTLQLTLDTVKERHGETIDVYAWEEEHEDPLIWETLGEGFTQGVFQVETVSGTRMCRRMKPAGLDEMAAVITLVRPGPRDSGLTERYIARREGREEVTYAHPALAEALEQVYGCPLYQENVLAICMLLALYASDKADEVRKILGKKKVDKVQGAGQEFVEACVAAGVDRQLAVNIWEELANFAKYSFNKSHAWAYAILACWTLWFKVHWPLEFLNSAMTIAARNSNTAHKVPLFVKEARRLGYQVLPPDVNTSGLDFTIDGLAVRYGLASIKGIGEATAKPILAGQPYKDYEDFVARSAVDAGSVKLLARIGALDSILGDLTRKDVETRMEWVKSPGAHRCAWTGPVGPHGLPCSYDWASEPVEIGRSGRPLKQKKLPQGCSTRCRHYEAPTFNPSGEEYSDAEIRIIEQEMLGVYLSSTPFDVLTEEERRLTKTAVELEDARPFSDYWVAAEVTGHKAKVDRTGKQYAFVAMTTPAGDVEPVCFSKDWERLKKDLKPHTLVLAKLKKTDRGTNLVQAFPA